MKLSHSIGLFLSLSAAALLSQAETHTHTHAHGETCTGDHSHEGHAHSHEGHSHAHGETCTGDHAHEGHDHAHEGHAHAHGETCTGDHAHDGHDHAHEGHSHAHGETCSGDHSHEGHAHSHEGHTHTHGETCSGDHSHEGHAHSHEGHSHAHGETCSGDHSHDGHNHARGASCGGSVTIVTADARARDLVNMRIETVPAASQVLVHSLYGYLATPPHAMDTYALPCGGRITLHVKSAQKVKAGDLLYTLQSPDVMELKAEEIKINASIARCQAEVAILEERRKELSTAGTRNKDLEVEMANKNAEQAQLNEDLSAVEARLTMLSLGGVLVQKDKLWVLEVHAAKDGIVRNVGVTQGSWGSQGNPVISMTNPAEMEIATSIYGSDAPRFSSVRATIPAGREHVTVEGTWRMDEQVDPATRTRELHFMPDSLPENVQAGQLCRLDLYDAGDNGGMIAIPDSAVVKVGVDDIVFVEVGEGKFAAVKVHAGTSRRGMTPVSGLTPGQRIVVKGGYELKYIIPGEGQKKAAGHFHADGKFHEGEDH